MRFSSAVVTPGRQAASTASRTACTMRPAARILSSSWLFLRMMPMFGRSYHRALPSCRHEIKVLRMANQNRREMRRLGATGPTVFPIALGCMGMSGMYGPSDEKESIATIHAALEQGVNLLDTGDFY